MEWKIYYGDGTTFSNEDGPAEEAPSLNVQAIVQADPEVGRYIQATKDYYWYEDGQWNNGDIFGLFDFMMRSGMVKFGRTITNQEYQEIYNRAVADSDFRPKSAFGRDERRPV